MYGNEIGKAIEIPLYIGIGVMGVVSIILSPILLPIYAGVRIHDYIKKKKRGKEIMSL